MKSYYIINPDPGINSLCNSLLDEDSFYSGLILVSSDESKKTVHGWKVTKDQVEKLYRAAEDKNISVARFQVAVMRISGPETLRLLDKREYLSGYTSKKDKEKKREKILDRKGIRKKKI